MDQAQAVIIGGGVGGTSIAYHLAERGWRDIVLVDRAELTSGSTFHSAGLVGQLRSSVTLTRMMMDSVALYRRLKAETGTDPAWHEVGSLRLASTPARMEELTRQAGWAKTFGLPLELIGPTEARDLFPLMSLDGVLGRRLPADRRLARSVGPGPGPRGRGPRPWRPDRDGHPGRGDRHGRRPGHRRRGREGRRAADDPQRRWSSMPGACSRRRSAGSPGSTCRSSRWPTSTCSPSGSTGVTPEPADDARPGSPVLLPGGGRRAVHGRLRAPSGAVVARRRAGRLQRQAPRPGLAALRRDHGRRRAPRAADRRCRDQPDDQRARGLHPGQRVHPRRERGPGVLRGRRLLRPRDRRRRRDRQADGQLDRRRRARARPLEDGHPALRRPVPLAGLHPRPDRRGLPAVLRHPLPQRGAPERPAAAPVAGVRPAGRARGASFGEKSGWERPNWFARNEAAGREELAAAGLGRRALVGGDRRRGARDADDGRPVRRVELRQDRGRRAGRGRLPRLAVRQRHRPSRRLDRLHPDAQPARRDRDATSRSAAWPPTGS